MEDKRKTSIFRVICPHYFRCLQILTNHYCPDVVSLAVGNVLQNNNLHLKQALSDLNSESLYNPSVA